MDRKQVIKILEYYPQIDGEIKFYQKLIRDVELEYYTQEMNAQQDGQPKARNNITNITEKLAINVPEGVKEDLEIYHKQIDGLHNLKVEIMKEMSCLKLLQKLIIFDKYVNGFKWEQVAVRNHYSARQCKNIRNDAVDKLSKRFAKNRFILEYDLPE